MELSYGALADRLEVRANTLEIRHGGSDEPREMRGYVYGRLILGVPPELVGKIDYDTLMDAASIVYARETYKCDSHCCEMREQTPEYSLLFGGSTIMVTLE